MASSTLTIPRSSSPTPLDDPPPSATSYLTAPQSPNPSYSSRSPASSTHTLPSPRESDQTTTNSTSNPLHALALGPPNKSQPQEVHIVQLTDDALHLQSTTSPDSSINIIHKVGHHHSIVTVVSDHSSERESLRDHRDRRVDQRSSSTGPDSSILRPSSPSSHSPNNAPSTPEINHYAFSSEDDQDKQSRITQPSPSLRPVTFDDSSLMMRERQPSTASSSRHYSPSKYPPPAPSSTARLSPSLSHVSRPSADTTKSSASASGSTRTLTPRISQDQDGLLHPSPPVGNGTMPSRPSRRNTTGSTSTLPSIKPVRMATLQSFPHTHDEIDLPQNDSNITTGGMSIVGGMGELGELESDIQLQAEQIRRERMSKRAKAEKARAEDQLARTASISTRATATVGVGGGGGQRDEVRPLVGNLIGEDHVNYVLMYNMLTGIRIAVSRCQAKIRRPLTDEDFTACHKYSFDIIGNELTPSAKYDFKFKDYAPWVFRELREDYFHLDPADYLLSLTAKYILSELGSPGKSGSFFYFSRDYRFIIKTIHHSEHKFLRSILGRYYEHVKENPHTLLSRFYGLHRVKLPRGRKIHFVIMNNLFPAHKDIHETYDLKGSTIGRSYPEDQAQKNPGAVLKDLNWIGRGKRLELGPEKRALLTEQLRRDSECLKGLGVMDYSLLVGIHWMERGNRDNVRSNTLKVFSPEMPAIRRKHIPSKGAASPEAIALRRIMHSADPHTLISTDLSTLLLPSSALSPERTHFVFYQDEGGLRATDERNGEMELIYYLGVIDVLTPYSGLKKIEHFWKGLSADRHKISPVPPGEYADRFFAFMKAVMRGGEGGARFKAE